MVHDLFDGSQGFAIDGGVKDSTHIRRLATELNSPMPALVSYFKHVWKLTFIGCQPSAQDTAHEHLLTARALHASKKARGQQVFDTLDWSSLVAGARTSAGLDGFDSAKVSIAIHSVFLSFIDGIFP